MDTARTKKYLSFPILLPEFGDQRLGEQVVPANNHHVAFRGTTCICSTCSTTFRTWKNMFSFFQKKLRTGPGRTTSTSTSIVAVLMYTTPTNFGKNLPQNQDTDDLMTMIPPAPAGAAPFLSFLVAPPSLQQQQTMMMITTTITTTPITPGGKKCRYRTSPKMFLPPNTFEKRTRHSLQLDSDYGTNI